MPRWIGVFVLALLPLRTFAADAPSVLKCDYVAKRSHSSGDASISLRDGIVQKISFDNFFEGAAGVPGCPCSLTVARDDPKTSWRDDGNRSEILLGGEQRPDGGDSLTVTASADGFLLDFSRTPAANYCGSCASLPQQVTVPKSGKRCVVRF